MRARSIMFQGTGSDVGKSLIVAGLARALANRGFRVLPFKPQNMSNNAAVTVDGGEIGRAQALQARAARAAATVHMNPVLLKPQGGNGSQIVVQGRVVGASSAADYQQIKAGLMSAVMQSFNHLRDRADFVLVEGAGSASEVNLRANDIANMGFARAADVPVILIGDIDRGGVIASIVGTKTVIDPADASLIEGFLINRFRGDPALFADGMGFIAGQTGWRAVGLAPHLEAAGRLPAEDGLGLSGKTGRQSSRRDGAMRIAAVVLPYISNFDDLDPLEAEPQVELIYVRPGEVLPGDIDLVILPGSKATIPALAALRQSGLDIDIAAHVRRGGHVLGICGGYQMLGSSISDPDGLEGAAGTVAGLGLLDVDTVLGGDKALRAVSGVAADGASFSGYEMHVGVTMGPGCARRFGTLSDGRSEGATSASGRVSGCYIHGLFASDAQRSSWLQRLGGGGVAHDYEAGVEAALDAVAAHLEQHLDIDWLVKIAR